MIIKKSTLTYVLNLKGLKLRVIYFKREVESLKEEGVRGSRQGSFKS